MKPIVKIIRKVDIEKQYEHILELASLFAAMNEKNDIEIEKSKKRLGEIQMELESFHAYA